MDVASDDFVIKAVKENATALIQDIQYKLDQLNDVIKLLPKEE